MSDSEETQNNPETDDGEKSVLKMAGVFVRAVLVMKFVIIYLGFRISEDPSDLNILLFVGALVFSFGSLLFYAARN